MLWGGLLLSNLLALLASIYFPVRMSGYSWFPYLGLALTVLGMVFRFYSIWSLGRNFTVDVTIREGHKLHTDGVYGLLRHPSYTGMFLSFVGFAVSLNTWLGLLAIVVCVGASIAYRINIEEKALLKAFGEEYSNYQKHTYRLIPWVF